MGRVYDNVGGRDGTKIVRGIVKTENGTWEMDLALINMWCFYFRTLFLWDIGTILDGVERH